MPRLGICVRVNVISSTRWHISSICTRLGYICQIFVSTRSKSVHAGLSITSSTDLLASDQWVNPLIYVSILILEAICSWFNLCRTQWCTFYMILVMACPWKNCTYSNLLSKASSQHQQNACYVDCIYCLSMQHCHNMQTNLWCCNCWNIDYSLYHYAKPT